MSCVSRRCSPTGICAAGPADALVPARELPALGLGPAGGLVTFSRLPVSGTDYQGSRHPADAAGISLLIPVRGPPQRRPRDPACARPAFALSTLIPWPTGRRLVADEPVPPLHRAQLAALTRVVRRHRVPAVACGDFNVDRESPLFARVRSRDRAGRRVRGQVPADVPRRVSPEGNVPHCIDFILTTSGIKQNPRAAAHRQGGTAGWPGYASVHIRCTPACSYAAVIPTGGRLRHRHGF